MSNQRYFILTARHTESGTFELLFGDYDVEVVRDEKRDCRDSGDYTDYDTFEVWPLPKDTQEHIDGFIKHQLNGE